MTRRVLLLAIALATVSACARDGSGSPADFTQVPGIGETRIDVPRPTSGSSPAAVCGADPLPTASSETIAQRVAAMRAIGLFADRSDLDDQALATEVESGIEDVWGDSIEPDDPLLDLMVAAEDRDRVWWQDLEADVADGNEVYVETLDGWAAISEGAFDATAITENWESRDGPVTISFALGGEPRELNPAYLEDWIDPGILGSINDLIAPSGRRFELYKSFDQTAFVMALTEVERQALEARGWCFE